MTDSLNGIAEQEFDIEAYNNLPESIIDIPNQKMKLGKYFSY